MRRALFLIGVFLHSPAMATCSSVAYTVGSYDICGAGHGASVASHISVTYSPTAGNGIFLIAAYRPSVAITSFVDQSSNAIDCFVASPNAPTDLVSVDTDDERWAAYYCPSIPSGITEIRANMAATLDFGRITIAEIDSSDIVSTDYWDNDAYSTNDTEAQATSFSVSVTNDNARDLMISWMHNGNVTFPPGGYPAVTGTGDYTLITSTPGYPTNSALQMKSVTVSEVQSSTITWTPAYNGFAFLAGLKAPAVSSLGIFTKPGNGSAQTTPGSGTIRSIP